MPKKIPLCRVCKKFKRDSPKAKAFDYDCSTIEHSFQLLTRRSPVRYPKDTVTLSLTTYTIYLRAMQEPQNNDSQLIVVQQNLRTLPEELVRSHADHVEQLDLSHNCLKDLSWLADFEQLRHLVLDSNRMHEAHLRTLTCPLPQLEVLMLNKNEFSDLPTTMRLIRKFFPNLQYLSLHGNPICPDGLELQPFSSYLRYDYEYYSNYIAQSLSKLKFLDHGLVQRTYKYESFPIKSYNGKQLIQTTSV